jgi:cellulose biosynthesis protein BcsQ
LSRTFDALRDVEPLRSGPPRPVEATPRPFQVVTVTSNKGGVGKTTLATNLAVYLRALDEEIPILVVTLDDQPAVDRMFALDGQGATPTIADGLRAGSLASAIRLGQYGVHYVPSSRDVAEIKQVVRSEDVLQTVLLRTGWKGLVIIDTKSDLEVLTRNAIAAADLSLVVVKDQVSLLEAERVFALLDRWDRPRERARVVLSLVDLRIRFREGDAHDVLGLLVQEVRRLGLPLLETFLSRSPKVESLYTNPDGRALSILHGAQGTPVHQQMHRLAEDVRVLLGGARASGGVPPPGSADSSVAGLKRWLLHGGRLGPWSDGSSGDGGTA